MIGISRQGISDWQSFLRNLLKGCVKRWIQKKIKQPVKKYLRSLSSDCKRAAILAESDVGDRIRIFLKSIAATSLMRCQESPRKNI